MSFVYRLVDFVLASNAGGEVRENDRLLLDVSRIPEEGELTLVRKGKVELLGRWREEEGNDVVGVVIGIKRKL